MTGAESNGEMKTKRNAVSFRGEINSFPFLHSRSISLSLSDAVSFLLRYSHLSIDFTSRASTDCTCSLGRSLTLRTNTLYQNLLPNFFRLVNIAVAAKLDRVSNR